jgi:hypothetical protein
MPSEQNKSLDMSELPKSPESKRRFMNLPIPEKSKFWLQVSQLSLSIVWDNTDDDVYEQLLKK